MTFSYRPGSGTERDRARFALGDTQATSAQFQDEEIDDMLLQWGKPLLAAAALADGLAAKFSRSVSFSIEGLSIQNSTKSEAYRKLAESLREQQQDLDETGAAAAGSGSLGMVITGVSRAEMQMVEENPDRVGTYLKSSESEELDPAAPDYLRQE